jgi:predicted nucleic acid-binding protein
MAGVISATGAAGALLLLSERDHIVLTVSEQVIAETERALAREAPQALTYYRDAVRSTHLRVARDPAFDIVAAHVDLCPHRADIPIILAAMEARVDFLVILDRQRFVDDPAVAIPSGVRIGTPGEALAWLREVRPNA